MAQGVNLYLTGTPRITFQANSHADSQSDGVNVDYNLSKIWATMGRVGPNATMRSGLIEEGDVNTPAPQCVIQAHVGGAWFQDATLSCTANGTTLLTSAGLFGGLIKGMSVSGPGVPAGTVISQIIDANNVAVSNPVAAGAEPQNRFFVENRWDSLQGYNPVGGLAAGDYCVFACILPFDEVVLHLGAALAGQPGIAIEYATGAAAWSAVPTVLSTPDFTQANSQYIQRLKVSRPFWSSQQLTGSMMTRPYYCLRIRLTGAIGVAPAANQNYKDWLAGYHKHFYCRYDLKRGDTAADYTTFVDGQFSLRFDDSTFNCLATILSEWRIGSRTLYGDRYGADLPWTIFTPKGPGTLRPPDLIGGMWICQQKYDLEIFSFTIVGSAGSKFGKLNQMTIAPIGQTGINLGSAASAALSELVDSEFRLQPGVPGQVIGNIGLDTNEGIGRNIRAVGRFAFYGVRGSSPGVNVSDLEIVGVTDDPSFGQLFYAGAGTMVLIRQTLMDGTTVPATGTLVSFANYAPGTVLDDGTQDGITDIPFRIIDSFGRVQADELTGAGGLTSFVNADAGAFGFGVVGDRWKNLIAVMDYGVSVAGQFTTLDNPITIEINREDHPNHNPGYESKTIKRSFPRRLRWNVLTAQYEIIPYQRDDMPWTVTLKPPCAPGTQVDEYTRKSVPTVIYQHDDVPATPYDPKPVVVTPFVRTPDPQSAFTPCPGLPGTVPFTRKAVQPAAFSRKPIPAVTFKECGTADPDMFILLGPWMPVRITGG